MDSDRQEYEELRELGNVFAGQPESRAAVAAMKKAYEAGATPEELVEISKEHLKDTGASGEAFLEVMPQGVREVLPPEALKALEGMFDLSFAQALAVDDESEQAPALLDQVVDAFGIHVHEQEVEGETVKIVQATIYPFINPEKQIARLIETCYQVYPEEAFTRPRHAMRDSEWYRRSLEGETCREIALSDSRSGIPPEAQAEPEEYGVEVERAEQRVTKAVQRFGERWTNKVDFVSTDSD